MKTMFWFLVAITLISIAGMLAPNSAMTECQKTHSYDVCFQQLNR